MPEIFKGLFKKFNQRLIRRCLSYHIKDSSILTKNQYQKILDDFNHGEDFISELYETEPDNFWGISREIYEKYKKSLLKNLWRIFQKEYSDLFKEVSKLGLKI